MSMRKVLSLLVVGLMAALVCVPEVSAQPGGGRRPDGQGGPPGGRGFGGPGGGGFGFGGSSLLGLLRMDEVRQELKVTEDQNELVEILGDDLREGRPDFPENFREMSDEEREAFGTKMREFGEQQAAKAKESLAVILDEAQFKRLNEINIQVQGIRALMDKDVAKELKLTEDLQKQIAEKIETSGREMFAQMGDLFRGGDRDAARAKMDELRKANDAQVLALLSDEQKAAFEKMKGEAFAMPEGFGRGGFGRQGRGGPGGGFGGPGGPRGDGGGDRPRRPE